MNATLKAQRAYAPTTAPIRSDRSMEYDIIARITSRLKKAIESTNFNDLVESLHENRKLWRVLAMNVSQADNELPKDLCARIFYLSEFTDHHTREVIRKKASAVPLLEVNTAILRGLRPQGTAS